jgi:hypothetical protein
MKLLVPALLVILFIAACSPAEAPATADASGAPAPAAPAPQPDYPLVEPITPGRPGGLPDDRTPLSEAPFSPTSAQGAANVLQTYFAHIGEGAYDDAYKLWGSDGGASHITREAFIASFDRYHQYNAQTGGPGAIEGAAGSLFVTVPVQIYGRLKSGEPFHQRGEATLRRINDVQGSSETQRLWRISGIEVRAVL